MKKLGDKVIKDFDGTNAPEDFDIPSVGIEDIDRAIFKLFNEKLSFEVTHKGTTQKVPVIFASGERFALTRRKNPIRDKNNTIILPVISIMRKNIDFSPSQANKGTAISFREQESYVVRYRLSSRDRKFQNIINKQGVKSQKNVSSRENFELTSPTKTRANLGTVTTRRESSNINFSANAKVALGENLGKNIFEVMEIPYPEFVAVTYNVVFWTQYMQQSNQMLETLLVNFTGQGEEIPLTTEAGYELVAFFASPFSGDSNLDEFTENERIIRHSFDVTVPGYIINPKHPGMPKMIRKYISAPQINFSYIQGNAQIIDYQPERKKDRVKKHVLNDLTNPKREGLKRGQSREKIESVIQNPFTKDTKVGFSKVRLRNERSGETVISSEIIREIETQSE
jgi:hypothetical protein